MGVRPISEKAKGSLTSTGRFNACAKTIFVNKKVIQKKTQKRRRIKRYSLMLRILFQVVYFPGRKVHHLHQTKLIHPHR